MPGVKGHTNNPNGRPPSGRALTEILKRTLGHTREIDGKKISGKRILARMLVDLLLTGEATFPGGKHLEVSGRDWLDLAKWLYVHVDGSKVDVTSKGQRLQQTLGISPVDYRDSITNLAPGSVGDSEAPGESESSFNGEALG